MFIVSKLIYRVNAIPIKIPIALKKEKSNPQIHLEPHKTPNN